MAALSALVTLVVALPAAEAHSKCRAGTHNHGGTEEETFCGPASVTVKVDGMRVRLKGGTCHKTNKYFAINIGTATLSAPAGAKKPNYFGLTVGKTPVGGSPAGHDGTYHNDAFSSLEYKNQLYYMPPNSTSTVKLTDGRRKGTFSGRLDSGATISGKFSCT